MIRELLLERPMIGGLQPSRSVDSLANSQNLQPAESIEQAPVGGFAQEAYSVELSQDAMAYALNYERKSKENVAQSEAYSDSNADSNANADSKSSANANANTNPNANQELSQEEQDKVEELEQRDQEVRQHEQAHLAAAGGYARGGIQYEYERGPDNRQYATGGHVNLDTSKGKTPEETVQKARVIQKAAMAPAEPSAQDRKVAQSAAKMEQDALQEIQKQAGAQGSDTNTSTNTSTSINTNIYANTNTGNSPIAKYQQASQYYGPNATPALGSNLDSLV
jgi:hypothetical protein